MVCVDSAWRAHEAAHPSHCKRRTLLTCSLIKARTRLLAQGVNTFLYVLSRLAHVIAASMAAMPFIIPSEDANNPDGNSLQPELQFARCMSNRYRSEEFPRCVSCTRRWAGDTCRFQGIRFFLKNQSRDIVGISFVDGQKPDAPTMNFPNKWNISLELEHIQRVKVGRLVRARRCFDVHVVLAADGSRGAPPDSQAGDAAPESA